MRMLCAVAACIWVALSPAGAATTAEPTADGLAIRDKAYRDHLVYIILQDGSSHAAKAPLKITSRSVTFTDADTQSLFLLQLSDVNMEATLHVNNDLIPRGLWMDEETFSLRDLELRPLSRAELQDMLGDIESDLEAAKEAFRDAYTGAACSGTSGAAAQLCAMNATAAADRKIRVIEKKAVADVH